MGREELPRPLAPEIELGEYPPENVGHVRLKRVHDRRQHTREQGKFVLAVFLHDAEIFRLA